MRPRFHSSPPWSERRPVHPSRRQHIHGALRPMDRRIVPIGEGGPLAAWGRRNMRWLPLWCALAAFALPALFYVTAP